MEDPKISKRKADDSENAITVTITPSESIIPSPTSAPPEKKHKKSKKEKKVKKEKKLKKKEKKEKPPLAIAQPIHANTPKTLVSEDQQVHDVIQMDEQSELEPGIVAIPQRARVRGPTATTTTSSTALSDIFPEREFSNMPLKKDHLSRPIWVCPDGHIMLETHSPIYKQAYDFLIAIAEPECRATLMHEYQLTPYSLYAAVSVGLNTEDIIAVLNRLSKVEVPRGIEQFIRDCTLSYGKVKLVLQRNRYYVESSHPEILEALLSDSTINNAKIKNPSDVTVDSKTGLIISRAPVSVQISGGISASQNIDSVLQSDDLQAKLSLVEDDDDERIEAVQHEVYSFEIDTAQVELVKKKCVELDFPMLEEYDFKNDTVLPNLNIDLKPTTTVRPYQEKSLSKMFGNGRARSGIIVLPCGAGKSLTGITAACTVKKSCLVLCISAVSVEQWRHQFRLWSNIEDKSISRFTSDQKELFGSVSGITVTTYTMVCFSGKRSAESKKIMEEIQNREWGLLILDEVHVVPAHMFRKVLTVVHTHCKLGLTATLVREDERIGDLNFLIGPKLYEANWMDLRKAGYIANVQCVEVWCPMTPEFYREYLSTNSLPRKTLLYTMNPNKFRNTQFLVNFHEQRGDKIIVFSDNIFALKAYSIKMKKPFIYGPTSQTERIRILNQFQRNPNVNTVFISKVGDTAIDLPEANVIIQISSHYGSRRQEAQRLGRILRPKARSTEEFNAFFYSLVSKDTEEMYYSTKRQQYLIDQGYSFKVITELPHKEDELFYGTKQEQLELLAQVLAVDEKEGNQEELEVDNDSLEVSKAWRPPAAKRSSGNAKSLSGADKATYSEFRSSGLLNRPTVKHPLFKKR